MPLEVIAILSVFFVAAITGVAFMSFSIINENEIGLVTKNIAFKKLPGDNPIAFNGEAAYVSQTGIAQAAEVRATALAYAEGFEKQVAVLGQQGTMLVNVARSFG